MMDWISCRNWRRFQHYDPAKRQPPWIKNYTELLNSEEYLGLNAGERSLLHGVWIAYASSQCSLKFDARLIGRRLNLRVTKRQLLSLVSAGFLDIVASKALADGYQNASARAHVVEVETEVEEEVEEEINQTLPPTNVNVHAAEKPDGRVEGVSTRRKTEAEEADQDRDHYGVPIGFERQPSGSIDVPDVLKSL